MAATLALEYSKMASKEDTLLHWSLSELPASQVKVEDLPDIMRQLDLCLQKSNDNVTQLKDSLKFVLDREASLQADFDALTEQFAKYREASEAKRHEIQLCYEERLTELEALLKGQVEDVNRREATSKL